MVKVGLPLSFTGAILSGLMIHIFGGMASIFDIWNNCPDYVAHTPYCADLLNTATTEMLSTLDINVNVTGT